jgi:hypothetical protein
VWEVAAGIHENEQVEATAMRSAVKVGLFVTNATQPTAAFKFGR